jgi:osmotically-inducible protein OsmY
MKRLVEIGFDTRGTEGWAPSPTPRELAERVRRFLRDRVPECVDVAVEASGCTVILHGHAPSSHAKRLCVECCRHIAGVVHVVDELEIDEQKWRKRPR